MDNGKIYQRPFGGMSKEFGKGGQATRTSAAADRTGHALLHTLYQQNIKHKTQFLNEWIAIDLLSDDQRRVCGASALCMETGDIVTIHARVVILATGGAGQVYASTTNAYINTGDGLGMVLRAGIGLQDMEMWQFHPTGLYGSGCLISEACRGEGAYLVNSLGERFMEKYAPHAKDLASRDVVSRAIATEIQEGRGLGPNKDYIHLQLQHLGKDVIIDRLPGIRDLAKTFANADPITDPIPIVPTQHYMMGGIPANKNGQVLTIKDGKEQIVPGLYAIGECACVSVHGANRLGGNSLLDLVVFGRAAGMAVIEELSQQHPLSLLSDNHIKRSYERVLKWDLKTGPYTVPQVRNEIQNIMQQHFSVFRDGAHMQKGLDLLLSIASEKLPHTTLTDRSKVFNTARLEALELDNILAIAIATAYSAIRRTESRGAHSRNDYPQRNDLDWLKHIVCFDNGHIEYRAINLSPHTVAAFEPKERTY
jgi:succinate dehydrogenase / fumarate reductase flavoprotein subunit